MTLPKFLLACADWGGFWKGCSRFRPAPNEPWSWKLVLGLTAGYTLMAVCIGIVLSLFCYHEPFTWLVWFTGAYMVAAGLCWFGLTALCWNQRAARLRANPASVTGLPRLNFRLFRWTLGFVYFVLIGLVTPLAMLLTIENVRSEWAWRSERDRLVALGEKLTFREILGPEIPAEQNAAAAPIFAAFFDYQYVARNDSRSYNAIWRDTNSLAKFDDGLIRPDKYWARDGQKELRTSKVNLDAWAEAYRKMAASPSPKDPLRAATLKLPDAPADPARVMLAALAPANDTLAAVCAASRRPRAQFALHYEEAASALLRHVTPLKAVSQTLQLRCAARLAAGDTEAAFEDAQCALRVSELLREEPLLISQLVRISMGEIAISTIWQGLAEHRWTDGQLAAFQDQLGRLDYISGWLKAFEGERACALLNLELFLKGPAPIPGAIGGAGESPGFARVLVILPRGIFRQNEIGLVRYHTRNLAALRAAVSNAPQTGLIGVIETASSNPDLENLMNTRSPYRLLARRMVAATGRAGLKACRAQTVAQMGIIACALERYYLKHGVFPEKLDELVPAFVTTPPLDPINHQPFHYQRTADGWFQFYSVGPNGKDDSGVFLVKSNQETEEKDWPWPVPSRPERRRLF